MTTGVSEEHGRALVIARSQDVCEGCGRGQAGTVHHRVKRSQGGTWNAPNLLRLCGSGTTGCHGLTESERAPMRELGWNVLPGRDPGLRPALIYAAGLWRAWWLLTADGDYQWLRDIDPSELAPTAAAARIRADAHRTAPRRTGTLQRSFP